MVLIVAAAFVVYGVTLTYPFVWDDGFLIIENRYLSDWSEIGENLSGDFFRKTRDAVRIGYWRPVITISYMIDRAIFDDRPWGFHLANVIMHALASCLVFGVARRLRLPETAALGAALLFAVHPVHVESVAWISGRTDVYCAVFVLAAILLDFDHTRSPSRARRVFSVAATALAVLSKEMALIVPALVALRPALLPSGNEVERGRTRSVFVAALPHAIVVLAYGLVRFGLLGVATVPRAEAIGRSTLFWTSWSGLVEYIRMLVWPAVLSVTPEIDLTSVPTARALAGVAIAATLVAVAWRWRHAHPSAAYALAFFLVALIPLSNFIVPINAPTPYPLAERYLYLPSVGFCLIAAWLVTVALPARIGGGEGAARPDDGRRPARWAAVAGLVLVSAYGARAHVRVRDWKDDLSLFASAVRLTPGETLAHVNYGVALADAGNVDAAEKQFREVLKIEPGHAKAHYNLGNLYREGGELALAEAEYRAALRTKPTHAQSHMNLALVMLATGRIQQAEESLRRANDVLPDNVDAMINLANVLRLLGRGAESIPLYVSALELEPQSAPARLGLAQAELESGRFEDGLERLRALVDDEPDLVEARLSLAIELDRRGRRELAEVEYLEALRLDPDNARVRRRLGLTAD
jgi:Flp pilus assembly protein TadD